MRKRNCHPRVPRFRTRSNSSRRRRRLSASREHPTRSRERNSLHHPGRRRPSLHRSLLRRRPQLRHRHRRLSLRSLSPPCLRRYPSTSRPRTLKSLPRVNRPRDLLRLAARPCRTSHSRRSNLAARRRRPRLTTAATTTSRPSHLPLAGVPMDFQPLPPYPPTLRTGRPAVSDPCGASPASTGTSRRLGAATVCTETRRFGRCRRGSVVVVVAVAYDHLREREAWAADSSAPAACHHRRERSPATVLVVSRVP